MEELKYPIGKLKLPEEYNKAFREEVIKTFEEVPAMLRETLKGIDAKQLQARYRPDAWTIRQVVHHLADSHMNCLMRFKLGLTEDLPTIKPYLENSWAALPDANNDEIEDSIIIVEGVHRRLVKLLKTLKEEDWERKIFHPESKREMSLNFLLALYAWHGKHHLAHIKNALRNPY